MGDRGRRRTAARSLIVIAGWYTRCSTCSKSSAGCATLPRECNTCQTDVRGSGPIFAARYRPVRKSGPGALIGKRGLPGPETVRGRRGRRNREILPAHGHTLVVSIIGQANVRLKGPVDDFAPKAVAVRLTGPPRVRFFLTRAGNYEFWGIPCGKRIVFGYPLCVAIRPCRRIGNSPLPSMRGTCGAAQCQRTAWGLRDE
jgi:hypothetical protein